jgi:hypothetical protein
MRRLFESGISVVRARSFADLRPPQDDVKNDEHLLQR